jgi:hypothetical protein
MLLCSLPKLWIIDMCHQTWHIIPFLTILLM